MENENRNEGRRDRNMRKKRKPCVFCCDKNATIDYKDFPRLKRFVSDKAKILPRRVTGVCARHQRILTAEIKRARFLAFLPYVCD